MHFGNQSVGSLTPAGTRSVSRKRLAELGNRLFDKGFNLTTMPSVRRRQSNQPLENSLAVTLSSFECRKRDEPYVLKKQSTVFPNNLLKRSETTECLSKNIKKIRIQTAKDSNKPARQLIDKIAGRLNADQRYNQSRKGQQSQVKQQPFEQKDEPLVIQPSQPIVESNLDKYIRLIQKKTMYIDEFLYLKKAEYDPKSQDNPDPYDLRVVDYQLIKAEEEQENLCGSGSLGQNKQYYTISRKGLCHYVNNKPLEFMPLCDWLAERQTYGRIKNLKFFIKFRRWKTVKMWKRNVIRQKIEACSRLLEERLFFLKPELRITLLNLRRHSLEMSSQLTFISIRQGESNSIHESTYTLDTFKTVQERKRRDCAKEVSQYSHRARDIVDKGFKNCLTILQTAQKNDSHADAFAGKKSMGMGMSSKANRRDNAYDNLGFGLKMTYEHRSQLRKQCSKFVRFSYLVDFIFQQSLGQIYERSLEDFTNRLDELVKSKDVRILEEKEGRQIVGESECFLKLKVVPAISQDSITEQDIVQKDLKPFDFAAPESQQLKMEFIPLYHTDLMPTATADDDEHWEPDRKKRRIVPNIADKWLQLKPSHDEIFTQISHCVYEGLSSLKHFKRCSKHSDMQKYVNVLEEWDDVVAESWEVAPDENLNPTEFLESYTSDIKLQKIAQLLKGNIEKVGHFVRQRFTEYLQLFYENQQLDLNMLSNPLLYNFAQTVEQTLLTLESQKQNFTKNIPIASQLGMFRIDSCDLKDKLLPSPTILLEKLRTMIPELALSRTKEVKAWMIEQTSGLKKDTGDSIDDYVGQIEKLRAVQAQFVGRKKLLDSLAHIYQVMLVHRMDIRQRKVFESETLNARDALQQTMMAAQQTIAAENQRFSRHITRNLLPDLQKSLTAIQQLCMDEKLLSLEQNQDDSALKELLKLQKKFGNLDRQRQKCQGYQKTLGLTELDFSNHDKVRVEIDSRIRLWNLWNDWEKTEKQWLGLKLGDVPVEIVKEQTTSINSQIKHLSSILPENELGNKLATRVGRVSDNLPIIKALRCQHLREDHWNSIKAALLVDPRKEASLTLEQLAQLKMTEQAPKVEQIALTAEKQYQLQCKFEEIEAVWLSLSVKIILYKGRGKNAKQTCLLSDTTELLKMIEQLLEEAWEVTSQSHARNIMAKACSLKQTLKKALTLYTEWVELQQEWRYLDNLFSTIQSKRLHESGSFESLDKIFRALMTKVLSKSKQILVHKLLQSTSITIDKIRETKSSLQQVYTVVNQYISDRRKSFSRFYFIDNKSLLELCYNPTPENLESIAKKCFRGISKLNFQGDRICSLVTAEDDVLKKNVVSVAGEVDQIFLPLQDIFLQGIRKLLKNAKVQEDDRCVWICNNAIQSVLTISKVQFTLYTQITISNQQFHQDSLREYFTVFCKDQEDLIGWMASGGKKELNKRDPLLGGTLTNKITQSRRMSKNCVDTVNSIAKINMVICHDIFNRDILAQLVSSSIVTTTQFLWQKHLRFYWDETCEDSCVVARHLLHSIKYGSEYVGIADRTLPSSSQESFTLKVMHAFNYGSYLIVKDQRTLQTVENLAATLGYNANCYICTPLTSCDLLQQFMTGIVNISTWGILKNSDSLSAEGMSFLAHILSNMSSLLTKSEKKKDVDTRPAFSFFIHCSQEQKLPQTIRNQYRTITISPMNLQQCIKIKLCSLSYEAADKLSTIIGKFLESLCLITQTSYDQKKLLTYFDTKSISKDEKQRVASAIDNWATNHLAKQHLSSARQLLQQLFQYVPDVERESLDTTMGLELEQLCERLKIKKHPLFSIILLNLQKCLKNKKCIILTGQSSYKSTIIKILAAMQQEPVSTHYIHRQLIKEEELFGSCSKNSALFEEYRPTSRGIISRLVETKVDHPPRSMKEPVVKNTDSWLIFEGYESLPASVLIDTLMKERKVIFNKGHVMQLPQGCRMFIECQSTQNIQPAVFVSSYCQNLSWDQQCFSSVVEAWCNQQFKNVPQSVSLAIQKIFQETLPVIINMAKDITLMKPITLLSNVLSLMSLLLDKAKDSKQIKVLIAYSCLWGAFGSIKAELYPKVEIFMRKHFENIFPASQQIFNLYLDETYSGFRMQQEAGSIGRDSLLHTTQFVVTKTNASIKYLVETMSTEHNKKIIMLTGKSDVGKTTLLKNIFLSNQTPNSNYYLTLHRKMTVKDLQQYILSRLNTNRKNNVLSFAGAKQTRIFIDDVAMVHYGDMQSLEVVRFMIDRGGILCDKIWKNVKDLRFCLASRLTIPDSRLLRHCFTINIERQEEDLQTIFECVIGKEIQSEEIKKSAKTIASYSYNIYKRITQEHPQTYFNLQDMIKALNALSGAVIKDLDTLKKYWCFAILEACNKVNNPNESVTRMLAQQLGLRQTNLNFTFSSICRPHNRQEEIKDMKRLMMQVNERIQSYNRENTNLPVIEYVTEDITMNHILRLHRSISLGHCIQYGFKNSGRSNIVKIVAYLRGYIFRSMKGKNLVEAVSCFHEQFPKEHCILVIPIESDRQLFMNVVEFFSQDFFENLTKDFSHDDVLKNQQLQRYCRDNQIDNVLEFYKQQKGKNMHFVLLISNQGLLRELIEKYPHVANKFTIDHFPSWADETFSSLAEVNLIDERLSETEIKDLRQAVSKASKIHQQINKKIRCSLKQYEDYIKLFVELYRQLNSNLTSTIEKHRQCNSKGAELLEASANYTTRLTTMKKEIENLKLQYSTSRQALKEAEGEEAFGAMQRMNKLEKELTQFYSKLIDVLEKRHSDIRKTVGMLQNVDDDKIKNLRNNLAPSTGLTPLIQLLMIIVGRQPQFKEVKEILGNFRPFLQQLKSISARNLTTDLVKKFREHSRKEQINNESIKKLPSGMQFLNVLIAIKNYITERDRNVDLNNEIKTREKEISNLKESYPQVIGKLSDFQAKLKDLEDLQNKAIGLEKEYQDLIARRVFEEKLCRIVSQELTEWEFQVQLAQNKKLSLIYDLLLLAAGFIYTAHLPLKKRTAIIEEVKENLKLPCSQHPYELLMVDPEAMAGVTAERVVFENMIIINNSIKTFLMIDPDHKAMEWLKTYAKQIKTVSQEDPHFLQILSDNIVKGGHLVVEVKKNLSNMLYGIICRIDEDTPTIRISDHELTVNAEFKLHVSVSQHIEITQQLMDLFTIISFEMGEEAVEREIRVEILKRQNIDMLNRQPELIKRKIALKNELSIQNKALLNTFNDNMVQNTEISEKTVTVMENIKTKIQVVKRQLNQTTEMCLQYRLPSSIQPMVQATHTLRDVMAVYGQTDKYLHQWSRIPYLLNKIKEAFAAMQEISPMNLYKWVLNSLKSQLSMESSESIASLLCLRHMTNTFVFNQLVQSNSISLIEALNDEMPQLTAELKKRMGHYRQMLIRIDSQIEMQEFMRKEIKINNRDMTILEKMLIVRILGSTSQQRICMLFIVKEQLGSEIVEKTTTQDILEKGQRIYLNWDVSFDIEEYLKNSFTIVHKLCLPYQLESMMKKGSLATQNEKIVLFIQHEIPFQTIVQRIHEPFFRDLTVVYMPKDPRHHPDNYHMFTRRHLRKRESDCLAQFIYNLEKQQYLIDKYSSSYHWQLNYLVHLLSRYDYVRKGNQNLDEFQLKRFNNKLFAQCRTILELVDNLSSEITSISRSIIRDEIGYNEQAEQIQALQHLIKEILFDGDTTERLLIVRLLMTKIAQEREYIVDVSQMHKRLSERCLDELLGIELGSAVQQQRNGKLQQFAKIFKMSSLESKDNEQVEAPGTIDIVDRGGKSENIAILESRERLDGIARQVSTRLQQIKSLMADNFISAEIESINDNRIPSSWPDSMKMGQNTVTSLISKINQQAKSLQKTTVQKEIGSIDNPRKFLDIYIRQFARKTNQSPQSLQFTINRLQNDKDMSDNLKILNLTAVGAQWDRKSKCFVLVSKETSIPQIELAITLKENAAKMDSLQQSIGFSLSSIRVPLYHHRGDTEPILTLDAYVNLKMSSPVECSLYLN